MKNYRKKSFITGISLVGLLLVITGASTTSWSTERTFSVDSVDVYIHTGLWKSCTRKYGWSCVYYTGGSDMPNYWKAAQGFLISGIIGYVVVLVMNVAFVFTNEMVAPLNICLVSFASSICVTSGLGVWYRNTQHPARMGFSFYLSATGVAFFLTMKFLIVLYDRYKDDETESDNDSVELDTRPSSPDLYPFLF